MKRELVAAVNSYLFEPVAKSQTRMVLSTMVLITFPDRFADNEMATAHESKPGFHFLNRVPDLRS